MKYLKCIYNTGNEVSLDIGAIYRALPTTRVENESGMVRIIDNEGEDYLYPINWFEEVSEKELAAGLSEMVAVHVNGLSKIAIRDMANAKGVSMSALVREWIDDRLDLPEVMNS